MSHQMYLEWSTIWETVEACDRYEVSTRGEVRNKETMQILRPAIYKSGYGGVTLCRHPEKRSTKLIHRLVALAFLDNSDSKSQVNHKDGNKLNNFLSNLEWATPAENTRHAWETGLNWERVKAVEQLSMDGEFIAKFKSMKDAAKTVGLKSHTSIHDVISGRDKSAGGYKWRLACA
jgi:hypothetical protein